MRRKTLCKALLDQPIEETVEAPPSFGGLVRLQRRKKTGAWAAKSARRGAIVSRNQPRQGGSIAISWTRGATALDKKQKRPTKAKHCSCASGCVRKMASRWVASRQNCPLGDHCETSQPWATASATEPVRQPVPSRWRPVVSYPRHPQRALDPSARQGRSDRSGEPLLQSRAPVSDPPWTLAAARAEFPFAPGRYQPLAEVREGGVRQLQ